MRSSSSISVFALVVASTSFADRITAASCSRADVGSAVDRAAVDDEVIIPEGVCDWFTTLRLPRRITLRGADRTGTVIRDGVPKDNPDQSAIFLISIEDVPGVRISTLTIEGLAEDLANNNHGHLRFEGNVEDSRVDHVTFRNLKNSGITFSGHATGVVDHCSFDGDHEQFVWVAHDRWDGGGYGDSSWASPPTLGARDAVYVEDSEFLDRASNGAGALVVVSGGRGVIRHSLITNDAIYVAGTDTSGRFRGGRHVEIYANRFVTTGQFAAIAVGSGTGVIFDNTFEGSFTSLVRLETLRSQSAYAPWGRCNGSSAFDQNSQASGYACFDQLGRGEGALVSGDTPSPQAWPRQVLDPLRLWNNDADAGVPLVTVVNPSVIVADRDYVEGTPRPGYQPFPYPHPLVAREVDAGTVDGGSVDGGTTSGRPRWFLVGCGTSSGTGALPFGLFLATVLSLRRRR